MVAKSVATRCHLSCQLRVLADEFPNKKESRPGLVLIQQIKKGWSTAGIGAIVEGKRHLPAILAPGWPTMDHRSPKELR